jgi:hypothetical protein
MTWKTVLLGLLGVVGAIALSGCGSFVLPPQGGGLQPGPNGDAWYVRNTYFIFPASSNVYYCDGSGVCRKATIR